MFPSRERRAGNGTTTVAIAGSAHAFSQYASPVQIRLGTAEEWRVRAIADNHPFHIHVNPFEVMMRTDADGNSTPMNVWRDTLFLRGGETYVVRSRFPEPTRRGTRRWTDKTPEQRSAVYANRRRMKGDRGKRLQRLRSEFVERTRRD